MHTLSDAPVNPGIAPPMAAPRTLAVSFTGDGKEYFRIWVANLLLTLATLGIYSAWAKVRRLQYFDRNTMLAGATFDFHGNPKAILSGRLLALVMLVGYEYAFGFSTAFGIAVFAGLLALFPYLMRGALRFRLGNTAYRGLSLGFDGSVAQAYLAWLPPALLFLLPSVALVLYPARPEFAAAVLPAYLAWPLMHARIRHFQHAHLLFGDRHSGYSVRARSFYKPYLAAGALALAGMACAVGMVLLGTYTTGGAKATVWAPMIGAVIWLYVIYLVASPYMVARVSNLAWSNTRFPGVRIRCELPVRRFMALQSKNALLTVLTLGLYRPFAVVSVYRFRLAHVHVELDGDLDAAAARMAPRHAGVVGDGAADGFGIDLSW